MDHWFCYSMLIPSSSIALQWWWFCWDHRSRDNQGVTTTIAECLIDKVTGSVPRRLFSCNPVRDWVTIGTSLGPLSHACTSSTTTYARNTPGSICQYKEDGLVSRPPSLFTSMRRPMHGTSCPKSQLKSMCLTAKFGSFLDHAETDEKGQNVISSSVQHPISLIFAIHVSLIILLPMMWILLTKPMQKSVTTVCLHCSFGR